jgi:hypothetical protein
VVYQGKSNLPLVADALDASSVFSCRIDGGQKKSRKHSDNGDDHKKFYEGKAGAIPVCVGVQVLCHWLSAG